MGETLPPVHLDCAAGNCTLGRGDILSPSNLEHVAGNYELHLY